MAVWYCGSVSHAAIAQFAISHAYSIGDIVRDLGAVSDDNARAFRCTTAGTSGGSESAWNRSKAATTTQGTAVFTEATGNSSWAWSAAHKNLANALNTGWAAAGDTVYVASDHAYSRSSALTITTNGTNTSPMNAVSVNKAGSTPPVAADLLAGATETTTGNSTIQINQSLYCYGVNWVAGSGASGTANIQLGSNTPPVQVYDTCNFTIATTGTSSRIVATDGGDTNQPQTIIWKTVTLKFGATAQGINNANTRLIWQGGSVDGAGSIPTNLFLNSGQSPGNFIQMTGVDLSALAANTIIAANKNGDVYQFINCKLGTTYSLVGSITSYRSCVVDMIISDNTTKNYNHERHTGEGDLTTETTNVVSGGANDGVTAFSWKVATNANPTYGFPFECFTRTVWNDTTGASKTLSVEILNSATTLKDNEIWVDVEYLNSASFPTVAFATSASNVLAPGANIATSAAVWDTTGISTPIAQKLTSAAFTPQMKGYIRYTVRVAKASKTIWVDPRATIA